MEEDYYILEEYVRDSSFESLLTPELFITPYQGKSNMETSIGIEVQNQQGTLLFIVSLVVGCVANLEDGRALFNLNLRYDVLVALNNKLCDEKIREYLTIQIPQEVYPHLVDAVYFRTCDIGYNPIKLDTYSFKDRTVKFDVHTDDETASSDSTTSIHNQSVDVDFEGLLQDIESTNEGKEFLQVYRNNNGPLQHLEDFNLTRCVFRYMRFVDFDISSEANVGIESKKLIFYLIASSNECNWWINNKRNLPLPELIIKYRKTDDEIHINQMNKSELWELCTSLIVDVLTNTSVNLFLIESEHGLASLPEYGKNVSREIYRDAFDYLNLDNEQQMLVDSLYDKITKTQIETFLYQ